jgi:hypothetical protein
VPHCTFARCTATVHATVRACLGHHVGQHAQVLVVPLLQHLGPHHVHTRLPARVRRRLCARARASGCLGAFAVVAVCVRACVRACVTACARRRRRTTALRCSSRASRRALAGPPSFVSDAPTFLCRASAATAAGTEGCCHCGCLPRVNGSVCLRSGSADGMACRLGAHAARSSTGGQACCLVHQQPSNSTGGGAHRRASSLLDVAASAMARPYGAE